MSTEDEASKTEEPTERKLKKAREKGEVPISKEVGHMMVYGGLLAMLAMYLPSNMASGALSLGSLFDIAGAVEVGTGQTAIQDLGQAVAAPISQAGTLLFGALGIMLVAAIISGVLQGPFVFSLERIRPKPNKLSPLAGFKRLASANNLVEFAKSFVKLIALAAIAMMLALSTLRTMLPGTLMLPEGLVPVIGRNAALMLGWILVVMIPVVILDIAWKRFSHNKKQRMSLKEIRDEHKNSEGDPQIKAKRDAIRRQRARQRMRQAVPTATLVVTNPTHYAVALRYERGMDAAPVCVAKGVDLMGAPDPTSGL